MDLEETLKRRIEECEAEISKAENLLDSLNEQKYELEQQLLTIGRTKKTSAFLQSINDLSKDNAMRVRLYNDSRTTPIMDEFYNSDMRFLVFERAFTVSPDWKRVSLVISKGWRDVNYKYQGLTMTDLKKAVGIYVSESSMSHRSKDSRLYPLYDELVKIGKKELFTGEKIPFTIPCLLGGQTFNDQTGFGSEYCGEDLVYQGKEYGETTKFFIIGVVVE